MNMARYELIREYADCTEYEDPFGYRILLHAEEELTKGLKCIDCCYISKQEWYWQDIYGRWYNQAGIRAIPPVVDNYIEDCYLSAEVL